VVQGVVEGVMTMVSEDKEFEYVTSQIIKHVERSAEAFKMFSQLFSLIVGGAIWLSIQSKVPHPKTYAALSDIVLGLVTVITSLMILENYRGWRGFRIAQLKFTPEVPSPTWRAECIKWAMIACMATGWFLFLLFNPFILASR
jgi:hypothetical protein